MQKRLVELIKQAENNFGKTGKPVLDIEEYVASHLLAEGIIVPPCKVGDTVYCIRYNRARKPYIKPLEVLSITTYGKDVVTLFTTREDRLGLTSFITSEAAEKAIAERREG